MSNLLQWLAAISVFLGIWYSLLDRNIYLRKDDLHSWLIPIYTVIAFGKENPNNRNHYLKYLPYFKLQTNYRLIYHPLSASIVKLKVYSAAVVLYRVYTFNDCFEAAEELKLEIKKAREDLKSKGFKFDS